MLKVIDVSRWQQTVNWPLVKNNPIDAAMIKIGGSDDGLYMDGMAQRNLIEARSAGMPVGMYVFLGGVFTIQEEVAHIKGLINQLGGLRPGEPFALDWERTHNDEVGYLTGIVEGLLNAGLPAPLIYMSLSRVISNNWQNLVSRGCGLWVASWGNNDDVPDPSETPSAGQWPFWALWQYSSNTNVPGIVGRVDQSMFNGSLEQFKAYGPKNNVNIPGSPTPVVPVSPSNAVEYTVASGDTLSAIAARYGTTWQDLYAKNRDRIANPNRIFTGQSIRVPSVAPAAPVEAPQAPTATHQTHIVVNGESLSVIAAHYGLPNWETLYNANRGSIGEDPNRIYPGQELVIP